MPSMTLSLSDFDYHLPLEFIAKYPLPERTRARLICLDRKTGQFSHHTFHEIQQFFGPGDVLVLNDTKVFPARLFGKRESGGKAEAFLLKEHSRGEWSALLKPGGRIKKGDSLIFGENSHRISACVLEDSEVMTGERKIRFDEASYSREILDQIGHIPIPPYLDRLDEEIDKEYYQTVFAQKRGAVAAPTAGLHFDEVLLDQLRYKGVEIVFVTLHVGYGTFQPIVEEDLKRQQIFEESFEITEETAQRINQARKEKRRIIACGTTVVRTLESAAMITVPGTLRDVGAIHELPLQAGRGTTRLFIYPPYRFQRVDALITNFHLPRSSLLMLVSAFAGRDRILDIYYEAIQSQYRFYSYGDAMMII